jgi:hypothetical protein
VWAFISFCASASGSGLTCKPCREVSGHLDEARAEVVSTPRRPERRRSRDGVATEKELRCTVSTVSNRDCQATDVVGLVRGRTFTK